MGFIPETIFRPLVSSAVGTAGENRAGEILGQAVARAGERITVNFIAKEAVRQQTLDIIASEAKVRAYEAEVDESILEAQKKHAADPKLGIKEIFDLNETLLNKRLEGITSEFERALFASKASTVVRRKNREMRSWARSQEVINASQDFTSITDTNAAQLKLNPDVDKFWEFIALHNLRKPLAKQIYGKNWSDAMRKGNQSMAKGLLAGYEDDNPYFGLELIRSGTLNKFFNGEELADLEEKMKSSIKGWDESLKFENNLTVLGEFSGADELARNGKLTTFKVDELELRLDDQQLLTPKVQVEVDKLRKIAAEKTDLTAIENTEILAKLYDELRNLQISSDKLTADATLTEIFKFRSHIYSASANGKISPDQRENFLLQIETIKTTGLLEATGGSSVIDSVSDSPFFVQKIFSLFSTPATPEQHAFGKVYDWLKTMNFSDNVEKKAKVKILNDTMIEITEMREQGTKVTNDIVDKLIEKHFREELARQNPTLQNLPSDGKAIRLKSGKKVFLFPDGTSKPIK